MPQRCYLGWNRGGAVLMGGEALVHSRICDCSIYLWDINCLGILQSYETILFFYFVFGSQRVCPSDRGSQSSSNQNIKVKSVVSTPLKLLSIIGVICSISDSLALGTLFGRGFRKVGGGLLSGGFGGLLIWSGLVCLGLRNVVCENWVESLRNAQLVLLELAETANHECILKVACNAWLKERHIIVGELGHAVFKKAANTTVRGLLTILNKKQISH